jgi:phosphoribosylformylglycinamidine (FGAM) synthase PurS component
MSSRVTSPESAAVNRPERPGPSASEVDPAVDPAIESARGRAANDGLPAAWRVEVFKRDGYLDPAGADVLAAARELTEHGAAGLAHLAAARVGRGYLLPPTLAREVVLRAVRELLVDPVVAEAHVIEPGRAPGPPRSGARRVLVMKKPGVMGPVAETVRGALARTGLVPAAALATGVATFTAYELAAAPGQHLDDAALGELGRRALANETIEELFVDREDLHYGAAHGAARHVRLEVPLRELDDDALLASLQASF